MTVPIDPDHIERLVAERTAEINAMLETRRMMIANASHELRTPVNALRLLADAAAMESAQTELILPKITSIADHLTQLVENLLLIDPDRPLSDRGGAMKNFDLGDELRATAGLVHNASSTLVVDVRPCEGLIVNGDLTNLRRIVINLLSNAFKFSDHGEVSIKAAAEAAAGRVTCTITVSDTGAGIPLDLQDSIFEPFVTAGVHSGQNGVGLGLHISRQIASSLGGHLRMVRSEPGNGSEFECVVSFAGPVKDKEAGFQERPNDEGGNSDTGRARKRVLVAEDDPITAESLLLIIKLLRHDVKHVDTFDSLQVELASGAHYDIALIDNRLPGGDGLTAIRNCRRNDWCPETRLVLVTADVTEDLVSSAKKICDEIISKPTTAHRIRRLLGDGAEVAAIPFATGFGPIDPTPLTMLARAGAVQANLHRMASLFCIEAQRAMDFVEGVSFEDPEFNLNFTGAVHRIRGTCLAVGASALAQNFALLKKSSTKGDFDRQVAVTKKCFAETKTALDRLLWDLC